MSLHERLNEEMKSSLKAGDKVKLGTIRFLIAEIKNRAIDGKKKELEDAEIIDVISSQIKKRKESIVEFEKGARADLVDATQQEIKILLEYLPPQLSRQELETLVADVIAKTGSSGPRDMGKVMGQLMPLVKGKADGRLLSEIVKERLS